MRGSRDDGDLREAFRHLRGWVESPERTPPFHVTFERARREAEAVLPPARLGSLTHPRGRWVPWPRMAVRAVLAAAAVAGILLTSGGRDPDLEFRRLVSAYAATSQRLSPSPTSRLLEVPGLELVRSVPSVGIPVGDDPRGAPRQAPAQGREIRS